jgi:hypothetical protein
LGGEAGEGGGGSAGFDGVGGVHDGLVEVAGGAGLGLAGEDALFAGLEGFESVEGLADGGVFGEGEELGWGEVVEADELLDVEVELEEIDEEFFVGGSGFERGGFGRLIGIVVCHARAITIIELVFRGF